MYRKIVWCYIIVLALLDISLNTKLSAQGKSHGNGVSVHESLMEGISLQEWGKEAGLGRAGDALALSPPALQFGASALAAAHARTVTLTNTGNETIHLASVAGTTPDFHASFFQSKTLVPQANTTFSVVYLGRREGPVSTHLFIHTSRGLLPYPVSAEGVASAWRVWPLVGLRVPLNATLEPMLTLYNPTDTTIQVSEVYSSGPWLGLQLPGGGGAAPRRLWSVPAHSGRDLVRLRLRLPAHAHAGHAHHRAYIRIKANMTGGGLVVGVEAVAAAPGEYLQPPQLRLRTRGSRDPPDTFILEAGNSDESPVKLEAEVWGARCGAAPPDPPRPPADPPSAPHTHNGGAAGAHVSLLRARLDAHAPPEPAARLTLHYEAMWAGAGGAGDAWCAGWARVGRAAAPYSLRLRPGTLALLPPELHFVTAAREDALAARELRAHNQFNVPVRVEHVHFPPELLQHFHTESLAPLVLGAGAAGAVARLRLRSVDAPPLRATLTLRTNLTDYSLPLLLYEGTLHFEWEWWPAAADGSLELGVVSALATRRVTARLHNRGAAPLCVTSLSAALPGATLRLLPHHNEHAADEQVCVEGGGYCTAELTLVAGEEPGALAGTVSVHTAHAASTARVSLRVARGRVAARRVSLRHAAPYVHVSAPLELDNSVLLDMRVTHLAHAHPHILYEVGEEASAREVRVGHSSVGRLVYAMELECAPRCATGLQLAAGEGRAWAARGSAALAQDARLAAARRGALALGARLAAARRGALALGAREYALQLHTSAARGVPVHVTAAAAWPALLRAPPATPLAGVGVPTELRVPVHNPSVLPLALHAVVAGGTEGAGCACAAPACRPHAWVVREWRATRGAAAPWPEHPDMLLLQPGAEVELLVTFTPPAAADLAACLYLRNNLTILESVALSGRGALPAFELGGREPNSTAPILLEVSECGAGGAGTVRRALAVRNTGGVAVRLREWRLAGGGCAARGFRLQPCGALALRPNETRTLTLHYTPDWTRARATLALSVRAGAQRATFLVAGVAPARLVAKCAQSAPRPPFEPALRALGAALAVLALLGAVALGALDAERALRRHRAARDSAPRTAPLDLRALAAPAPPACPEPPPARPAPLRRRRTPRRRAPLQDAAAERRAFERWRAGVARHDDSRSSEDGDGDEGAAAAPPAPPAHPSSSDSSPAAARREVAERTAHEHRQYSRRSAPEGASSGEESSEHSEHSERSEHSEHSGRSDHSRSEHSRSEHSDRSETEEGPRDAPPPEGSLPPDVAGDGGVTQSPTTYPRESSSRREGGGGGAARGAGAEARVRTRSGSARSLGRKERGARRRRAASPPAARPAPDPAAGRAPPAVRWGASWSSVVSRGAAPDPPAPPHPSPPAPAPATGAAGGPPPAPAPLAPIGSDVRRRAPSHSLFYYGAPGELPWAERAPRPPPAPPQPPRADYSVVSPARSAGGAGGGGEAAERGYRALQAAWGAAAEPQPAAASWLWGPPAAPPLRPPPGFAPRPYDPFQSLASIWTPLEWRRRERDPPSPAE